MGRERRGMERQRQKDATRNSKIEKEKYSKLM